LKFINNCDCIYSFIELEKAVIWFANGLKYKPVFTIWLDRFYPKIWVCCQGIRVHRILGMYKEKNGFIGATPELACIKALKEVI